MINSDSDCENRFSPNPYNFVNPVSDEDRFADREEELNEIQYYLAQADADTYYQIAIIGSRASGKSSLLNRVESISAEEAHLPVKISLSTSIVESQLRFFKEILDSIMAEGVDQGVIGDSLLEKFRQKVEGLDLDVEASLGYSSTYVRAKQSQDSQPDIPQRVLRDDLENLYEKASESGISSIVLLLDEADLLAENTAVLQKLRNIFSDITGFNLILCGTEEMFGSMNDVFSPMSRSFKKIGLGPFQDPEKTQECVKGPLSESEIDDLDDQSITEVHDISGGSPYEINLICHYMYKRYQEGDSEISLTPNVLDDVAEELDRIRQSGHHEISDDIKRLMPNQLQILVSLLEFPEVPKDWLVEFSLLDQAETLEPDSLTSNKENKRYSIESLIEEGIIEENANGDLTFAGSDFDQTYLKYYAAAEGVIDDVSEFEPGILSGPAQNLYRKLLEDIILTDEFSEYRVHTAFDRDTETRFEPDIREGKQLLLFSANLTIPPGESKVVEFSPQEHGKFYQNLSNATRFRSNVKWMDLGFVTQVRFLEDGEQQAERLAQRLETLQNKLGYLGYEIDLEEEVQYYSRAIDAAENRNLKEAVRLYNQALEINPSFARAWANKALTHQNLEEVEKALDCYDEALELRPDWGQVLKQKGILLIEENRFEDSLGLLEQATEENEGDWNAWHNKGRALMNLGQFENAITAFETAEQFNRENPLPVYAKALCYLNLERYSEAVEYLQPLLEEDSRESLPVAEIKHKYAIALAETGEHDAALSYYVDAVEELPMNKQAWYNKAMTELELGKIEEASDSLEKTGITDLLNSDISDLSGPDIEELPSPIEFEEGDSQESE